MTSQAETLHAPAADDLDAVWRGDRVLAAVDPDGFDVLSLDVFGTLLLRACAAPEDVFLLIGERARALGLLDPGTPPELFRDLRAAMETRARRLKREAAGTVEVSFAEIYRECPPHLGDPDRLRALEFETERRVMLANPAVVALARAALARGRRVCLVSDMYLGRAAIIELLEAAGIDPALFGAVFVSSETGASKHAGDLFGEVVAWAGGPGVRLLHIGDHPVSDHLRPLGLGIPALLYQPPADSAFADFQEAMLGPPSRPSVLATLRLLARQGNPHAGAPAGGAESGNRTGEALLHDFGAAVLGPALIEFCRWIVEDCRDRGIRAVFPLMREGRIFAEFIGRWAAVLGVPLAVKPLYVSRRATFLAAVPAFDGAVLDSFFLRRTYTVGDLLEELGVRDALGARFAGHADTAVMEAGDRAGPEGGTLREALTAALLDPGIAALVEAEIAAARARLADYLAGAWAGLAAPGETVALVDFGAAGSTQMNVMRTLRLDGRPAPRIRNHLMYGSGALVERTLEEGDYAVFFGWSAAARERMQVIYRSPEIYEQFLIGTEGSTIGYGRRADGSVVPVTEPYRLGDQQRRWVTCVHEGFEACWRQTLALEGRRRGGDPVFVVPPADLLHALYRCVAFPTPEEAAVLGALRFDDNFGSSGVRAICEPEAVERLRATTPDGFHRAFRTGRIGGHRIAWPQGCLALAHPAFLLGRLDGASSMPHQAVAAVELMRRLAASGARRIKVYGAGEIGRQLLAILGGVRMRCVCVIDRNTTLHGLDLRGVPIVSLAASLDFEADVIVVASVAFAGEISRDVRAVYGAAGREETVLCIED